MDQQVQNRLENYRFIFLSPETFGVNSNDFLKLCPINGDKHCGTVTTAPQKRRSSKEAAKPAPRKWCSKNRSEKDAATAAKKRSVNGAACVCAFARACVCVCVCV